MANVLARKAPFQERPEDRGPIGRKVKARGQQPRMPLTDAGASPFPKRQQYHQPTGKLRKPPLRVS